MSEIDMKQYLADLNDKSLNLPDLDDSIITADDLPGIRFFIPSGSTLLNKALSGRPVGGGYPAGRFIEIFGEPAHGKTTLALHAVKEMQEMGGIAHIFDTECALALDRCKKIGVDTSKLVVLRDNTVEAVFEKMERIVSACTKHGKKGLIVWDSIASTTTEAEAEADYNESSYGIHARLLSKSLRKFVSHLGNSDVCLIAINQLKQNIGGYGPSDATLGGEGPKFHSSIRLHVKKKGTLAEVHEDTSLKDRNLFVGIKSDITTVKNKITSPNITVNVPIRNENGIDDKASFVDFLIMSGAIKQAGAWCSLEFKGEVIKFYASQFEEKLEKNPELKQHMYSIIDSYNIINKQFIPLETSSPEAVNK